MGKGMDGQGNGTQSPLMGAISGEALRARAAHGYRMIASTMRFIASDLSGTEYAGPIWREADRVEEIAAELSRTPPPTLRLV